MLINLGCIKIRDTANICVMRNTIHFFLAGGLTLPFVEGVAEFDRLQKSRHDDPESSVMAEGFISPQRKHFGVMILSSTLIFLGHETENLVKYMS